MNRFSQLEEMMNDVKDDFSKFYEKDNKAAGTRIRVAMQSMKVLAQEIRLEVQNIKNAAPVVAAPAKKAAPSKAPAAKAAPAKKAAPAPAKKAPAKKK